MKIFYLLILLLPVVVATTLALESSNKKEFVPNSVEECIKLMDYLLSLQETSFLDYCKLAGEYCLRTLFPEWCSWFFITYEEAIFNAVITRENPEKFCSVFAN